MINIPIYRAKKIDSEDSIEGFYSRDLHGGHTIGGFIPNACGAYGSKIDPSTLAINFPDMKDSNDKPIFASLSESGKGGDMIHYNPRDKNTWTAVYNESRFQWMSKNELTFNPMGRVEYLRLCPSEKEVIGIQND